MNPPKERIVVCERCGAKFTALGNRATYCPDCRIIRKRESGSHKKKKSIAIKPLEGVLSVEEIASKAKALNMTYGEYVAKYDKEVNHG